MTKPKVQRKIHSHEELQRMFGEFGLGTEKERRRFRQLGKERRDRERGRVKHEFTVGDSTRGYQEQTEDA